MSTLVLGVADAALGAAANAAAGLAASALTSLVFGSAEGAAPARTVEGPRLAEMAGLSSTEGAPIPRLFGRARLGGQLIWATRFEEVVTTTTERAPASGGKSLGGGTAEAGRATMTTSYSYFANVAVGLCEGPVAFVRRVWADGEEMDLSGLTWRLHRGTEDQEPDPLIVAKEGTEAVPAYRGLAYVVFERLPLARFGNRLPQLSFEVVRTVPGLPEMVRAVCLIPGSTEFGYDTAPVVRSLGLGASRPENTHQLGRTTDVAASLDALGACCPNLAHVSLVVSWFGDDLRAGACTVAPRVDAADKATIGAEWSVSGLTRATARPVSRVGDSAAYGGTPSDGSVIRLIGELRARGLGVTLYPFVMMDVPAGNALPDPRTGEAGQPPYPWRGRITCDPAPGRPGSPDGTPDAGGQVAALFGAAETGAFTAAGDRIGYAGPDEWSLRRLVLHYARLAVAAGGVDAFVIGSEMVGLTRVRDGAGSYPAVAALRRLAADARAMLGPDTRLTYSADWTEYGAHVLDGGREVRFPLDPLWADPAIDAVGIDWYPPLADWRDGPANPDAATARGPADVDALRDGLGAGEAFDWFYANDEERRRLVRRPIADGAFGKPWTFRPKDLAGWWGNVHRERTGGAEIGPTAWVAGGKPIWLNEVGIPAVDKGPNGPNVFPDPKSSESALPPFSTGARDDLVQARGLEAILSRFDPALPGFREAFNPIAAGYPGRMVDPARTAIWAWDARPFPAFPDFASVWADSANWRTGHWINGRLEGVPLDRLVQAILDRYELAAAERPPLDGFVDGYVLDRPMSARDALEPLAELFGFDVTAGAGGGIVFVPRGGGTRVTLDPSAFAVDGDAPLLARVRAQDTELPAAIRLAFTDGEGEYARAAVTSRRLAGSSRREEEAAYAAVLSREEAGRLADIRLADAAAARETATFALGPRALAVEPGDVVSWPGSALYRVARVESGALRRVTARSVEPAVFTAPAGPSPLPRGRPAPAVAGPPALLLLDLPAAPVEPPPLLWAAVAASPWPGAVALDRSEDGTAFTPAATADAPAILGRTLSALPPGPVWRWDDAATLDVELSGEALESVSDGALLAGANRFAMRGPDGAWEIVAAATATLTGRRRFRLSRMLRGLGGSELLAARAVPAGAALVLLDGALVPLAADPAAIGRPALVRARPAGLDGADPRAVVATGTPGREALLPLPPVHLRARRDGDGVRLAWIRQTRTGGDGWEVAEVPLGEDEERYLVDIRRDGAVLRTLETAEPRCLYPAAAELADFGAPQTSLTVAVAQWSRAAGRGRDRTVTLRVG